MKVNDLTLFLKEESGKHTTNIYMPSIKRDVPFKPLTTADVKTLSRIGVLSAFDLNNELLKLALFDKLVMETKESCELDSETLTQIDFLAFLIGLRKLMSNELSFSFTCKKCNKKFDKTIDLETEFSDYLFGYEKGSGTFEKIDNEGRLWKFELQSYTMKDYLYYKYYLDKLKEFDSSNPDVLNEGAFVRPVLYISKIFINEEEVTDWKEQTLANKIKLMNSFPTEVILNTRPNRKLDPTSCLASYITMTFYEEKMFSDVSKMSIVCPHCGEEYRGVFKFDDFFTF